MENIKRVYNLRHLSLFEIFDRGHPLLKIFVTAFFLLIAGLFASSRILALAGGMLISFMLVPLVVWLCLKLK